jgi:uncharacterized protein YraI
MKRLILSALAGLFLVCSTAFAGEGFVTAPVNLRAGPDVDYPIVLRLPAGVPVDIVGCVDDWLWCDVIAGPDRGWVAGAYLQEEYGGRRVYVRDYGLRIGIPIISFAFGDYWDHYYRGRSWYGHRDRWSHVRPRYYGGGHHGGSYYSGSHYGGDRRYGHGGGTHERSRTYYGTRDSGHVRTHADYSGNGGHRSGDYGRQQSRDYRSGRGSHGGAPAYQAAHTPQAARGGNDGGRHSSGGQRQESRDRHGGKRGHDDNGSGHDRDHRRH